MVDDILWMLIALILGMGLALWIFTPRPPKDLAEDMNEARDGE